MDVREAAIVLGVRQDATIEQVRDAYRSHARLLHPDRLGKASQKDKQTAHEAMARINDAYAVFQAHLRVADGAQERRPSTAKRTDSSSGYPRRGAPPTAESQQPQEGRRLAQFDALLSHPRGWDLNGVLRIIRTYGAAGRVSAVFESDDLDARGTPVFDEEVFVATGVRAPSDGTLTLRGGGSLVLMGGRWEAERVLTLLGLDPSLARPKRRSNRRVLLFAGAGIVALIATLGVAAVVASERQDGVPTAAGASSATAFPVAEESSGASAEEQVTCDPGGPCAVGDTGPGGGIVFYDAGSPQPWGRYLEVARADWLGETRPYASWCDSLTAGYPQFFSLGSKVGLGANNTQEIIDRCGDATAAGIAANYSTVVNEETIADWYLPTQDELELLDKVPGALAKASAAYWSSSSCLRDVWYSRGGTIVTEERVGGLSGPGRASTAGSCVNQDARLLVIPVRSF